MDLKDFVRDALQPIVEGVRPAQARNRGEDDARLLPGTGRIVTLAGFDLALASGSSAEPGGALGVLLGIAGLGGQRRDAAASGSQARIRSDVPIALPVHTCTSAQS